MRAKKQASRRDFLKASVVAGAMVASHARAQTTASQAAEVSGANDRIRIGVIGCGGRGTGHHIKKLMKLSEDKSFNIEVAAVCDIYEPRKRQAKELTGGELFHDYRKLLDRKDIDAVVIATPDHWHARMTLDAMEAGKDVHVEKPMTLYWEDSKKVYEAAQRLNRVLQVGAGGTSRDVLWQARKVIADGKLGKVVWVTGGVYRNIPEGDWNYAIDADCSPGNLDWDAFLGPAPKRPFEPERFFRFRKYWDYSGGLATDLTSHVLSAAQVAMGAEFPSRVSAAGGLYVHKDRETPDTFHVTIEYPSGYVATLFCTQNTEKGVDMVIRGERASIVFPRRPRGNDEATLAMLTPEPAFSKDPPRPIKEQPRLAHDEKWITCLRTREKPHCDAEMGYKVMVALDLAVRSWREGKMFTFDSVKQQVIA